MEDDRLRVSHEADYIAAIGLAIFTFARLEWDAIWCIEKMNAGSIATMPDRTAGGIAKELVRLVAERGLPQDDPFVTAANDFQRLVGIRNAIAHGKPGTAPDGGQRLFRDDVEWTFDGLNSASDEFTYCQIRMNDILYEYLGHPKT